MIDSSEAEEGHMPPEIPAAAYLCRITDLSIELATRADGSLIEDQSKGLTTAIVYWKILHGNWSV